jgi:hypothetical protein
MSKWKIISKVVMKACCSKHFKNNLMCKDKWCSTPSDLKNIYVFMACMGIIKTIEPWAIKKKKLSIFLEISDGGYIT